ncbi:MAG: SDR family oxidoreductase [Victivallales bacterium]|nr:SDR family oxidoreductase [Victivallales bacterium]
MKKVVLITGGARRVGAALCRAFAADGWRVVIHCNGSHATALRLERELGGTETAAVVVSDLRKGSAGLITCASGVFGRLDGVVNNASVYSRRSLSEMTEAELREDFEVNFFAPFTLMREFARRRKPGFILNLLDGRIAKQDFESAGYLLAKQSLAEATRLGALAWAPLGIRVNGLAPGLVRPAAGVPLAKMERLVAQLPLKRRTTEQELAEAAVFLAKSPGITGEVLYVDAGMHLASPQWKESKGQGAEV